jgi:hypothetical protein
MERIERTHPRDRLTMHSVCPACGTVDVPLRNLHLWVERGGLSSYSFVCPGCSGLVRAPADAGTVSLLLTTSPPIDHDDLTSFRRELDRDDWWHRFERHYGSAAGAPEPRARRLSRVLRALAELGARHRMLSS